MHIRTQIRNELKKILLDLNTTQQNVFFDFYTPINKEKLPALVITTSNEQVNSKTIGYPALQDRVLLVKIIGIVKSNILLQEQLDQILLEVEQVLNTKQNKKLGNITYMTQIQEVNFEIENELDEDVGFIEIVYNFNYRCYEDNTSLAI